MSLILLEALGALVLLLGIVWWTMFAGRPKGELKPKDPSENTPPESEDTSTRP
jgi:cytoskeletal protein RodZ